MSDVEYSQGISRLKKHNPNHPLLSQLEKGLSAINKIYLKKALADVPTAEPEPSAVAHDDPTLEQLKIEQRKLFSERAQLSNRFHKCKTDAERAANSNSIKMVQRRIQSLWDRIDYFEANGELPKEDEKYPLPDDRGKLQMKINSLRASISQKKKKILSLYDQQVPKADIEAQQRKLDHLENYLAHATKKFAED